MKYKVGDKLKVREDFVGPTREFSRYQGEIVTVKCVGQEIDRQWYRIEEDGGRHHWPEIAFEQLPTKALPLRVYNPFMKLKRFMRLLHWC